LTSQLGIITEFWVKSFVTGAIAISDFTVGQEYFMFSEQAELFAEQVE
jgi:hypothetical protein